MEPFERAAAVLPPGLRQRAMALPEQVREGAEELRLRALRRPTVVVGEEELPLEGAAEVSADDLERVLEIATQASAHAALEKVRRGWFTLRGGCRLGLCGQAAAQDRGLGSLSSINIRIAREVPGCGAEVLQELGSFRGALLLAPPGAGKTTLLRDLVRLLSDGGVRVGLCDERGEVAALWRGEPQFDVGERTDILDGFPKAEGLLMLLRGMNPRLLACDEVTAPADCAALETCANCGVRLLATAHGGSLEDLRRRRLYRDLLRRGLFDRLVTLRREGGGFRYAVEELPC